MTNLSDNTATSFAAKWFQTNLQETLKAALVAEKICTVDHGDSFYIWNPYGSTPTTVVQAIVGTYAPATYTSSADTLTVTDEFIVSEHVYDFAIAMQHGDILGSRGDEMTASVATSIDKYCLNYLLDQGTGTLDTPSGGFTTAANVNKIFADLWTKWVGYADTYKGVYIVLEAADITGVIQAGTGSGYSYADSWLKNGFMTSHMGIDIYVVKDGTFVTDTLGTKSVTCSGHRVAGVKGIATYAAPRGIQYQQKPITAATGYEVVIWGYIGFNGWYQKRALTVDITIK
jgi:hypothetical protein